MIVLLIPHLKKFFYQCPTFKLTFFCYSLKFLYKFLYYFILVSFLLTLPVICQVHSSRNYIPIVISSPSYTSLHSMAATFLAICLTAVLQPSGYSIFYSRNTPFNLVFHDRVTPVSVSTLKPLLGIIEIILLKLWASSIVGTHI